MAASGASRELFTEGVHAVLHSWPVLQLKLQRQTSKETFVNLLKIQRQTSKETFVNLIAVDNGFGGVYGHQKADWMVDVVQQFFHDNADLQRCEVEDFISELMDQEFDTVVDDGSLPQVCDSLMQMFGQWQQGALQPLQHTISTLTQKKSQRAKVTAPPTQSDEDEEEDDGAQMMECESSGPSVSRTAAPPQGEDDGWTVVRKKK